MIIFEALDQIKTIESTSNIIKEGYKSNAQLVKNLSGDQDDILRSLN